MMEPHLQVQVAVRGGPHAGASPATVRLRGAKMLAHWGLTAAELSIALVDDETMRCLNRDYRNIDRPTDVLAFAMNEGPMQDAPSELSAMLGDVVIAVPTARRQAARAGRPLLAELTMLLAHGLLHLLGYNHHNRPAAKQMNALRRQLEQAAVRPRSRREGQS